MSNLFFSCVAFVVSRRRKGERMAGRVWGSGRPRGASESGERLGARERRAGEKKAARVSNALEESVRDY